MLKLDIYAVLVSTVRMDGDSDPVMAGLRERFEKSEKALDELVAKIHYPKDSARKSAWQFIHRTNDPRLSMLRRFADAVGASLKSLV